ncbi:hypothetical protein [Microlunatus sp. GCM10028923]|uniref:hypothetical protein n=1 Tax=Microlunatus sp. GCM10028923 TaxID=3273400 RepID=UPI0036214B92
MNQPATPEAAAADLIGRSAWGARQGHGSFLDLQFGPAREADPKRGAFHLWIYQCAWRIEHGAELGAGSEDSHDRIEAALARLNGRAVTAITLQRPSLSTTFEFGDSRLITFETATDPADDHAEQWLLFRPDDLVLGVGPGSAWQLSPADQA